MIGDKNFSYLPPLPPDQIRRVLKSSGAFDVAVQEQILGMQLQHKHGVQVIVEKEVSDLLIHTDIPDQVKVGEIPWLHHSMEIYFEDPNLPTLIGNRLSPRQVATSLGIKPEDLPFTNKEAYDEPRLVFMMGETEGIRTIIAPDSKFQEIVLGKNPTQYFFEYFGIKTKKSDPTTLQQMVKLVIAVMFYAATKAEAKQDATRKQLHFGGKAGVKGRPNRPIKRIVCLPAFKQAAAEAHHHNEALAQGERRAHPRRGHFRTYRDERFVLKRGDVDFIPPTWVSGHKTSASTEYHIRRTNFP